MTWLEDQYKAEAETFRNLPLNEQLEIAEDGIELLLQEQTRLLGRIHRLTQENANLNLELEAALECDACEGRE